MSLSFSFWTRERLGLDFLGELGVARTTPNPHRKMYQKHWATARADGSLRHPKVPENLLRPYVPLAFSLAGSGPVAGGAGAHPVGRRVSSFPEVPLVAPGGIPHRSRRRPSSFPEERGITLRTGIAGNGQLTSASSCNCR